MAKIIIDKRWLRVAAKDENGATAIEYAMIASGISIVVLAASLIIGNDLIQIFQAISDGFAG